MSSLNPEERRTWQLYLTVAKALFARMDAEFEAESGVPVRFYDVFIVLEDAPDGMRMNELAERVRYSKGGLTRVIDEMEKAGLVRRHRPEDDRRSIFLFITPKGTAAKLHARAIHHAWIRRNFADLLERADLEALVPPLEKLSATHSLGRRASLVVDA